MTFYDNPVFIRMQELVVEQETPDSMHEFASAVRQDICRRRVPSQSLEEIMERVG